LTEKYLIPEEEADHLRKFLEPMLQLEGSKRATAKDMLLEPWLEGILTLGEFQVDLQQRIKGGLLELDDIEKDALKPTIDAAEKAQQKSGSAGSAMEQ